MTGRTGLERKDGRQEITMSVFACLFQVFFRFGGGGGEETRMSADVESKSLVSL